MIVEPVKAKKYVQVVANLIHCVKSKQSLDGYDTIDSIRNDMVKGFNLKMIENQHKITKELVNELGAIPNQVDFLIEDTLPYDAYTFIDELEDGNIDPTMEILFLCMIHALDMMLIYYSPESKSLRQYEILLSNNSFHSDNDEVNNENKTNHTFYVFLYPDGTQCLFKASESNINNMVPSAKAHSFQVAAQNEDIAHLNPLHMTFDGPFTNARMNQLNLTHAPTYQNLNNSMMPPSNLQFQKHPAMPDMARMRVGSNMDSFNKSANFISNSYGIDPMSDLKYKFNHSMNVGHVMDFRNNLTQMQPPPNTYGDNIRIGGFQSISFDTGEKMNQTQQNFYPLNRLEAAPPPKMQPGGSPPMIQRREEAKTPDKDELSKSPDGDKDSKASLSTGSKMFKPATVKNTSTSFYKKEPKAYLSYLNAAAPGMGYSKSSSSFTQDMAGASHSNTTFQGMLPSMLPISAPPMGPPPMPPALSTQSTLTKAPVSAPPPMATSGSYVTGRLKYFKENDNYGFIVSDVDGENIFFHYSEMKSQSLTKSFLAQAKNQYIIR